MRQLQRHEEEDATARSEASATPSAADPITPATAGSSVLKAIEIDVTDTGVGIAPDHISKLFLPYSQATSSTQREHGGTGLGLSIACKIAKNMCGSIHVDSTLGVGSTFHTRLLMEVADDATIRRGLGTAGSYSDSPDLRGGGNNTNTNETSQATSLGSRTSARNHSTRRSRIRKSRSGAAAAAHRILIVDDHEINCKLLARMVVSMGFACDVARDGIEAIEALKANMAEVRENAAAAAAAATPSAATSTPATPAVSYLCVFLDLHMPRLDGWGCIKSIRGDLALTTLPVIALTAESQGLSRAIECGFTRALAKPFRKPALQAVLQEIVAERRNSHATSAGEDTATPRKNSHTSSDSGAGSGSASDGGRIDTTETAKEKEVEEEQRATRPLDEESTAAMPSEVQTSSVSASCSADGISARSPLSSADVASTDSASHLPSSPQMPENTSRVSNALATLHAATRDEALRRADVHTADRECQAASVAVTPSRRTVDVGLSQNGACTEIDTHIASRPMTITPLPMQSSAAYPAHRTREASQSADLTLADRITDFAASDARAIAASQSRDGVLECAPTLSSASPPLRQSSRHPARAPGSSGAVTDCTPSSHRRSLRGDQDAFESQPAACTIGVPTGFQRGGGVANGTRSPLGFAATSPIARHLVIDPALSRYAHRTPVRRSGSCSPIIHDGATGSGSAPGRPFGRSSGLTADHGDISDSIVVGAGRRAPASDESRSRRLASPRVTDGAASLLTPESAAASIPPLHPVSTLSQPAAVNLAVAPPPNMTPSPRLSSSPPPSAYGSGSSVGSNSTSASGSADLNPLSARSGSSADSGSSWNSHSAHPSSDSLLVSHIAAGVIAADRRHASLLVSSTDSSRSSSSRSRVDPRSGATSAVAMSERSSRRALARANTHHTSPSGSTSDTAGHSSHERPECDPQWSRAASDTIGAGARLSRRDDDDGSDDDTDAEESDSGRSVPGLHNHRSVSSSPFPRVRSHGSLEGADGESAADHAAPATKRTHIDVATSPTRRVRLHSAREPDVSPTHPRPPRSPTQIDDHDPLLSCATPMPSGRKEEEEETHSTHKYLFDEQGRSTAHRQS